MKAPLSLEAFADWLTTMPADGTYNYVDKENCAFCQYLKFLGIERPVVDPFRWTGKGTATHNLPDGIDDVVMPEDSNVGTFGAALQRARELLAVETSVTSGNSTI